MRAFEFIIVWLPTCLQVWILILLVKKALLQRFRAFAFYTAYVILIDFARSLLISSSVYSYFYWITEAVLMLASMWAMNESFRAIFGVYYRLPFFRLIWPCTIGLVWMYSGIRAWVHPPPHLSKAGAMLGTGSIVSSYTIVVSVLLFFLLVKLVVTRHYLYEFRIVYGLGIASWGMVAAMLVRYEFGTKFAWLTAWGPPLAYFVAVIVWLSAFMSKEPEIKVDQSVDVLLQEMKEDLSIIRRIHGAVPPGRK